MLRRCRNCSVPVRQAFPRRQAGGRLIPFFTHGDFQKKRRVRSAKGLGKRVYGLMERLPTVGEKAKCSPPQTAQTALGLVRRRGAKHREKCWKRELSKETYSRPTPNSAIATSDSISGDLHTIV